MRLGLTSATEKGRWMVFVTFFLAMAIYLAETTQERKDLFWLVISEGSDHGGESTPVWSDGHIRAWLAPMAADQKTTTAVITAEPLLLETHSHLPGSTF